MTRQEIYDKVVRHFLSDKYSYNDPHISIYFHANKTKSLVGCLIPEDKYKDSIEYLPAHFDIFRMYGLDDLVPHQTFIEDIQWCENMSYGDNIILAEKLNNLGFLLDLIVPEDLLTYNIL